MCKLVAAKRKLGANRSILVWCFLTFEHNGAWWSFARWEREAGAGA